MTGRELLARLDRVDGVLAIAAGVYAVAFVFIGLFFL